MSSLEPEFNTNLSLTEMEALIRRVVKEAVHEEFARLLQNLPGSVAENWAHEGKDDSAGDQLLLVEALTERERYRTNPEDWLEWEAFKAELKSSRGSR